jgi:hypothetical protein
MSTAPSAIAEKRGDILTSKHGPRPATPKTATVTGDVDVYDVPGGVGKVIGMLDGGEGQTVQLGSGCREDKWCNIVFAKGPGGTAWVYGDPFLKLN